VDLVRQRMWLFLILVLALAACTSQTTSKNSAEADASDTVVVQLFLVGDSTMSEKEPDRAPETGWGMVLADFAKPSLTLHNHAKNGRSTKSFMDEGRWESVLEALQPGDYVLIQFGHNDEKTADLSRFTAPREEYTANLRRYVEDARAKGAHPILATPVCRRHFDEHGRLQATHGDYPAAMRDLASELDVPLVDLQAATWNGLQAIGPEHSVSLFLHLEPGQYANYPDGKVDDTHFSRHGALWVTHLFLQQLRGLEHPLAGYFYGG
jgi:DNA sulfur modification protein DndE